PFQTTAALAVNTMSGWPFTGSASSMDRPWSRYVACSVAHCCSASAWSTLTATCIHGLISYSIPKNSGLHIRMAMAVIPPPPQADRTMRGAPARGHSMIAHPPWTARRSMANEDGVLERQRREHRGHEAAASALTAGRRNRRAPHAPPGLDVVANRQQRGPAQGAVGVGAVVANRGGQLRPEPLDGAAGAAE